MAAEEYAAELFTLTNAARADEGLPALRASACAEEAALDRAAALVGRPLEHAPLQPVLEACGVDLAAENLVDSDAAAADVVEAWMGSPGHRNNIVDPALESLGVGCVPHEGERLCAQIFLAG
ncbi:CAP domain-containing protein [Georgenia sp. TF02-10]|uniref:CAP domain-containing protein n=1 Tax=Georgenia sp. TF02-10 TaxID=2917725 RepID=UPI001FA7F7F4|nr:CAP domain-containing protein [Georgenia sp. TF02-10]UNX55368.1 CAP domain-containing protein [Georgenia sp. TF02-10]